MAAIHTAQRLPESLLLQLSPRGFARHVRAYGVFIRRTPDGTNLHLSGVEPSLRILGYIREHKNELLEVAATAEAELWLRVEQERAEQERLDAVCQAAYRAARARSMPQEAVPLAPGHKTNDPARCLLLAVDRGRFLGAIYGNGWHLPDPRRPLSHQDGAQVAENIHAIAHWWHNSMKKMGR